MQGCTHLSCIAINVRKVMYNVKVFIRGWLGYFGIASMRNTILYICSLYAPSYDSAYNWKHFLP